MENLRAGAGLASLALRQCGQSAGVLQSERAACAAALRTATLSSYEQPSTSGHCSATSRQAGAVAAVDRSRHQGSAGAQRCWTLHAASCMTAAGLAAALTTGQRTAQCDAVRSLLFFALQVVLASALSRYHGRTLSMRGLRLQDSGSPHALVERIWQDVVDDLDRNTAQTTADSAAYGQPVPPEVDMSRSSQIIVRVPVRRGVDAAALERALSQLYSELRDAFSPGTLKTSSISVRPLGSRHRRALCTSVMLFIGLHNRGDNSSRPRIRHAL